jgi:hypothetical protein
MVVYGEHPKLVNIDGDKLSQFVSDDKDDKKKRKKKGMFGHCLCDILLN